MKYKIVLASLLLMFAFTGLTVAKNSFRNNGGTEPGKQLHRNERSLVSLEKLGYRNLRDASQYSMFLGEDRSSLTSAESRPILLNALPYKNILNAGKWSRMLTGRALASRLKKNAHVPQDDDMLMVLEYGGGGCNWTCCFKQCMGSAMSGTGTLCTSNCTACGVTGGAWPCAVCLGCGTVGFAAIEFCGLHCCVDPGC